MIKAIIIDDEKHCCEILKIELQQYCPLVDIIATTTSSEEGVQLIQTQEIDLVFLDIEMPVLNGFDVLRSVDTLDFDVIFVTAYDQYAIKAFKYSAIDYLLKPIDKEELINAVNRVQKKRQKGLSPDQVDFLLSHIPVSYTHLTLPTTPYV